MSDTEAPREPTPQRLASLAQGLGALLLFGVLVTANSGGYRYGVADQAFYIPAIQRSLVPSLFPKDATLLDSQARLVVVDEAMAWVVRMVDLQLPETLFLAYLVTVFLFGVGLLLVGTALFRSKWTVLAFLAAIALRHRIAETGVNTFEGHFHPRVLAFSLGLIAIGSLLRGRRSVAIALVAIAFAAHPTTAAWFAVWVAIALAASLPERRLAILGGAVAAGIGLTSLWAGALAESFRIMDGRWLAALAQKDYLFSTDWTLGTWLTNAIGPLAFAAAYAVRRRCGLVSPIERTISLGCVSLLAVFAGLLPFVEARVALAVQLQPSRILWPIEVMATAYLVWAVAEAPIPRLTAALRSRPAVVACLLILAAASRGAYILGVEQSRPLVSARLPATAWQETASWAAKHTARDAHFLVDPGHAWKHGVSFRLAAERDILLEEVKDAAIAVYSRDIALRVNERVAAIGDFSLLTEARVTRLAATYDLDYFVTDRHYAFPLVFANQRFRVYSIPRQTWPVAVHPRAPAPRKGAGRTTDQTRRRATALRRPA